MPPEVMQTALLDEWVIVPRKHTDKRGITMIRGNRYPIPETTLWQITYDCLVKESKKFESGSYEFDITSKEGSIFKVTVEKEVKNAHDKI